MKATKAIYCISLLRLPKTFVVKYITSCIIVAKMLKLFLRWPVVGLFYESNKSLQALNIDIKFCVIYLLFMFLWKD